tara:strand:+ start:2126 stop:2302 length:177 start_codon:yes stop_codon:yes gene_type:complete
MKTNKNDPVLEKNELINVNGITKTMNPRKILNNDFSLSIEKIIIRAIIEAITEPIKTS